MEKKKMNHSEGYDSNGKLFGEFKTPNYEEWKEAAIKLLKGKPFEKSMYTKTPEGITLNPIYNRNNLDDLPYIDSLPGFYPYLRGTKAEGNVVKPWEICQEIYESHPEDFRKALEEALYKGQTALKMTLDLPSQFGYDADHKEALNVGIRGTSISTLQDVSNLLQDLVLNVLPIHINVGMHPVPITALIGAHLKKGEHPFKDLKGVLGYDPLGMLAKHGKLPISLDQAYDAMADVLKFAVKEESVLRTILVEGHPYHNGGADAVQELSFAMSTGTEYLRAMTSRGISINDVASHMAFSFSLGSNFFMELSKIRAARVTWAKIVESFGGNTEAQKIFIHGKTSSWTKTVYDPYVNLLRNASEAFSGAIGGVDSLDVVAFDEPIRASDDFSRRVSRNVQSILQDECRFTQPIDPAGGSWYVESLTHEISEKAWEQFQDIEVNGGMFKQLEKGIIKEEVQDKYEQKFKDMSKRKYRFVGTNMYANMTEEPLDKRKVDADKIKISRAKSVQNYRLKSDMFQVEEKLSLFGDYKLKTGTLSMDIAIDATLSGVTLGDLSEICYRNNNEQTRVESIYFERGAVRFETLRDRTKSLKAEGKCTEIFLFNYGSIPKHKGRADFSTGFFEVGGFEILKNDGYTDIESAVEAGINSGAKIGIICSTDDIYKEVVPQIAKRMKELSSDMTLIVAGRPTPELEKIYRNAGVSHFIYMGADCYGLLTKLQKEVL